MAAGTLTHAGFTERWLRRCGERPWRMFVLAWLALTIVWLVMGAVGLKHTRNAAGPPPVGAVPYANILATARSMGYTVEIDPAELPVRVRSSPSVLVGYGVDHTRPKDQPRLIALTRTRAISYGWPVQWLTCEWTTVWDVTDPSATFQPAEGYWKGRNDFDSNRFAWARVSANGAKVSNGQLYLMPLLGILLSSQILAGLMVGASRSVHALRQRRRRLRALCLNCGHVRTPAVKPGPCPECGVAPSVEHNDRRSLLSRGLARPACLYLLSFLIVLAAYVLFVWTRSTTAYATAPTPGALAADSSTNAAGAPNVGHVTTVSQEFGWPLPVVTTSERRVRIVLPGMREAGVVHAPPVARGWQRRDHFMWREWPASNELDVQTLQIDGVAAIMTLLGLQVVALLITRVALCCWRMRNVHKRKREAAIG